MYKKCLSLFITILLISTCSITVTINTIAEDDTYESNKKDDNDIKQYSSLTSSIIFFEKTVH